MRTHLYLPLLVQLLITLKIHLCPVWCHPTSPSVLLTQCRLSKLRMNTSASSLRMRMAGTPAPAACSMYLMRVKSASSYLTVHSMWFTNRILSAVRSHVHKRHNSCVLFDVLCITTRKGCVDCQLTLSCTNYC